MITGGLVLGLGTGVVLFWPIVKGLVTYRAKVRESFRSSKALKTASSSLLYRLVRGILEGVTP